jgi:hypothetical protein
MSPISTDTHPEADRVQTELLRQAPAWRKLQIVGEMNQAVRTLALSGLRQRFPRANDIELQRRFADLWLGEELAVRAYGKRGGDDL